MMHKSGLIPIMMLIKLSFYFEKMAMYLLSIKFYEVTKTDPIYYDVALFEI